MTAPVPTGAASHLWGSTANESYVGDVAVAVADAVVEQPEAAIGAIDVEPGVRAHGRSGPAPRSGSTRPVLTSPAQPTTATGVRPAATSSSSARLEQVEVDAAGAVERDGAQVAAAHAQHAQRAADDVVRLGAGVDARLRRAPRCRRATGRRPSRSPACCRAAPMPTRLAVEPPDGEGADEGAGKPSSSTSQRTATASTRLPGVRPPALRRGDRLGAGRRRCRWSSASSSPSRRSPGGRRAGRAATISSRSRARTARGRCRAGERLVERAQPGRAAGGRVGALEPQELLEAGEDGGEGLGQVVGEGRVGATARRRRAT